jgi:hypothetical protein
MFLIFVVLWNKNPSFVPSARVMELFAAAWRSQLFIIQDNIFLDTVTCLLEVLFHALIILREGILRKGPSIIYEDLC